MYTDNNIFNKSRSNSTDDDDWTVVSSNRRSADSSFNDVPSRKSYDSSFNDSSNRKSYDNTFNDVSNRRFVDNYPKKERVNYDNYYSFDRKQDNYKKILCKNINSIGKCIYMNKCLYAHSLEDQNVDSIRAIAYNMIKKDMDLSNIDLTTDKLLYNTLLSLSKLCQQCEEGICTGGYNCKHGACDKIYVVCQIDLNKGTCTGDCGKIHLTKRGLVPYGVSIVKNLKVKITIPEATIINDDFFKKLNDNIVKDAQLTSFKIESETEFEPESEINEPTILTTSVTTWADIIKNDDHDCESEISDDDILEKLHSVSSINSSNYLIDEIHKEEKLTRSIFNIDIMVI